MDKYQQLGVGLLSFGAVFSSFSYIILHSNPFTAFGLSTIILGTTLLFVPESASPTQHIRAMIEASLVNIEALLEEYNVMGKAVYLAPVEDRVAAFIPLNTGQNYPSNLEGIPRRVYAEKDGVKGVVVYPPGSELVRLNTLPEEIGLEDALNMVLVDYSELADNIKAVVEKEQVIVEISAPKTASSYDRVNHSMGSLTVSIAGCVIANALNRHVFFMREEANEGQVTGFYRLD